MVDPAFDFDLPENLGDRFKWGPKTNEGLKSIPVGYGVVDGDLVFLLKGGDLVNLGPLPEGLPGEPGAPGGSDAATAEWIETGPETTAALSAKYAGRSVGRFIARARAGATLKVVGLGDSITAGTGATLGVNDWMTLALSGLQAQYPDATITQSNRALSGATVATATINGRLDSALTDKGDLYLIGFGKNDTVADAHTVPVQGYPLTASMRGLEMMIRRIRHKAPQSDIVIVAENPNIAADTAGNALLQAWNARARSLAAAYACEFVDVYNAFANRPGGYADLLSDAVHLSVAGHVAFADEVLAHFPVGYAGSLEAPGTPSPEAGVYAVTDIAHDIGFTGWVVRQALGAVGTGIWENTGTWAGPNPYTTSTAGDYTELRFVGSELAVRFSTASVDNAVVDISVDGVTTHTNLSLTTVPSNFQPFVLIAAGLDGTTRHTVRITLKSGTLKVYQVAWLAGRAAEVPAPTPRSFIAGRYYGADPYVPLTNNPALGTAMVSPIFIPRQKSFNRIGVDITTPRADTTIRLGLYGSDQDSQPWGLIADFGTIDAALTGFQELTISQLLDPGWYWLAYLATGATAPSVRANNASLPLVTTTSTSTANALNSYGATGLTALPARWTSTIAYAATPRLLLKAT